MGLKEMLKDNFSSKKKITTERYKAAKFMFIISVLLFFLNFYLAGAQFYPSIFLNTLGVCYIILLLSFFIYFYYFLKKLFLDKFSNLIFIFIVIIFSILFILLLLPIVMEGGLLGILELLGFSIYL